MTLVRKHLLRASLATLFASLFSFGCSDNSTRYFERDRYPAKLSDWNLLSIKGDHLQISDETFVYDLNSPLFSDYAHKLRTIFIPKNQMMTFDPEKTFEFPMKSVITKTFFYEKGMEGSVRISSSWSGDPSEINLKKHRLIETRLLVKHADGWEAIPYIWRDDEAHLNLTGSIVRLALEEEPHSLNYLTPSKNQCKSCHATNHTNGEILPIGPKARHLNKSSPLYAVNQIDYLTDKGILSQVASTIDKNAVYTDMAADLSHRARSYLDINCGHCHNENGAADTSGLLLDYKNHELAELGLCKPPIAAGKGSGGRMYSITPGRPKESIMSYRLSSTHPAAMMPELGRALVDEAGVALINEWISSLPGECI